MSWYVEDSKLARGDNDKEWWQETYYPGDAVPVSGIYRCLGCNREVTSNQDDPFPPQNHHQHERSQGAIRWKLNVRANTKGG
jgi:hypothetical protein